MKTGNDRQPLLQGEFDCTWLALLPSPIKHNRCFIVLSKKENSSVVFLTEFKITTFKPSRSSSCTKSHKQDHHLSRCPFLWSYALIGMSPAVFSPGLRNLRWAHMCVSITQCFYSKSSSSFYCSVSPPTTVAIERCDLPISRTLGCFCLSPGSHTFSPLNLHMHGSSSCLTISLFFSHSSRASVASPSPLLRCRAT